MTKTREELAAEYERRLHVHNPWSVLCRILAELAERQQPGGDDAPNFPSTTQLETMKRCQPAPANGGLPELHSWVEAEPEDDAPWERMEVCNHGRGKDGLCFYALDRNGVKRGPYLANFKGRNWRWAHGPAPADGEAVTDALEYLQRFSPVQGSTFSMLPSFDGEWLSRSAVFIAARLDQAARVEQATKPLRVELHELRELILDLRASVKAAPIERGDGSALAEWLDKLRVLLGIASPAEKGGERG